VIPHRWTVDLTAAKLYALVISYRKMGEGIKLACLEQVCAMLTLQSTSRECSWEDGGMEAVWLELISVD
jgi:hypothetical protein